MLLSFSEFSLVFLFFFFLPFKRNRKQRIQNPSKSLKIPLLRQKDDNLSKVR